MTTLKLFFLLLYAAGLDGAYHLSFPMGGLFNQECYPGSVEAFDKIVAKKEEYHGEAIRSQFVDTYSTALEVCDYSIKANGIAALIDVRPTYGICDTVCMLCNKLNISHLSIGWEHPDTLAEDFFSISYYPPSELISKAFATLISKELKWDKFTFLYEDDSSFIRLQEVINTWSFQEPIIFRQLDPDGDNREIFKDIFKVQRFSYHILDCHPKRLSKYFEEIMLVENSTTYQSFLLTNLDSYTVDLSAIDNLYAIISTLHLTPPNNVDWRDIGVEWTEATVETALMADALKHLEKAIRTIVENNPEAISAGGENGGRDLPKLCFKDDRGEYEKALPPCGVELQEALLSSKVRGYTGNVEFDEEGKRTNIELFYSRFDIDGHFTVVGKYNSTTDTIEKTGNANVVDRSTQSNAKSEIKVLSKIGKPYFDIDPESNSTYKYRGYAVDLVNEIFMHINEVRNIPLKHTFILQADGKVGNAIDGSNKWDGMIGELMEHNADMAVCDITITSDRNAVVDFTTPFMSLGISILMKENEPSEPNMFSFINPLSLDVWLYLATAYIVVSFILLICARMSQGDWVNPHPCNQNPENLENIWSLYNCMWLTMGAIMTQGCDILPRAGGSRWITGMWWFFALIVTASYTANMSTFLSNDRRSNDIADIKALSEQNKVSYGAMYNTSTYKFFETSNDTVYQKVWQVMKSAKPSVFTNSNDEGKERVLRRKGNYAFFMESSFIEYYMQRDCELRMVGQKLDSKDYGIAMPKNSPYKGLVDNAILSLQESGKLEKLKTKWWVFEDNPRGCAKKDNEEDNSGSLQMKNTSGIFLVLGVGGILGFIVAIIDFILHAHKISFEEKITFKEALASEWRASLNPRDLHKPAAPVRSAAPSTASPSPRRERSHSRAVSVLKAASSFINFDEIY